jgi:TolB-like protein
MVEETTKFIRIDLNQFKLHLYLKPEGELTLHFDSPSRRFYLSVIGLVVYEMKKSGKITSIPLQEHLDVLALLNDTVGGSAGSSSQEHLLPRIYRKWKDALPDLENAPLFKVVGRKKRYDESMEKVYGFSEGVKDSWANLFEYKGSHENVRLRFSIDRLDASLDDVIIVYGENPELVNEEAWENFIVHLNDKLDGKPRPAHANDRLKEPVLPLHIQGSWLRVMPRRWQWLSLCALIGSIVGVASFVVWKTNLFAPKAEIASVEKMVFPLPEKPSIAVLPFRNLSDDPKQDYFSDGLTEEIITGLSKISSLFVIAPNTMFTYSEKPVEARQVSEELGVRFVLIGSVRKDEDRVRITAQLLDAIEGQHLWAERYDRELKDIFDLQDEITLKVLKSLITQLSEGEKYRLIGRKTDNLEAYIKIFEGAGYLREFNINASIRCFEEARTLDPQFAEAYAREALSHMRIFWLGPSSTRWQSFIRANESAKKCAELDDELAACNMALGIVHLVNRNFIDAISEGKRAVERWPNSAEAATYLALILGETGSYGEALGEIERALRLDPLNPGPAIMVLGFTYFNMGRIKEAITTCKKIVEFYPHSLQANMVLALAYSLEGRKNEARSAVNNILTIRPNFSEKDFLIIFPRKTETEIDTILNGLLKEDLK